MAKRMTKKEKDNRAMLSIIIESAITSLVVSIFIFLMFGPGRETIVTILECINTAKISAWEIAVVFFPVLFVMCTLIKIIAYIIKANEK